MTLVRSVPASHAWMMETAIHKMANLIASLLRDPKAGFLGDAVDGEYVVVVLPSEAWEQLTEGCEVGMEGRTK